jgi:hypothetical protein
MLALSVVVWLCLWAMGILFMGYSYHQDDSLLHTRTFSGYNECQLLSL